MMDTEILTALNDIVSLLIVIIAGGITLWLVSYATRK